MKNRRIKELLEEHDIILTPDERTVDKEGTSSFSHCQWSILTNDEFAPALSTVKKLPAGLYEIIWNQSMGQATFKKQAMNIDELYHLPSPEIQSILDDIQTFWNKRDQYKKYNFVHKRGILLWGEPGCGKSGIIQLCVKSLIENEGGIVINIKDEDDFRFYVDNISTLRKIEPERPLIVILEDIDALAGEDRYSTTKLLNVLDGVKQIENVVYIATTNYPDKLEERISNRPSRFDRRFEVHMPSAEIRESYIKKKLSEDDLKKIDLNEWVEFSDGMSLSHLKELVVSVVVMGKDLEEAKNSLLDMKESPKIKKKMPKIGLNSKK